MNLFVIVIPVLLASVVVAVLWRLRTVSLEKNALRDERDRLVGRFQGIVDADAERARVLALLQNESEEHRATDERERSIRAQELEKSQQQIAAKATEILNLNTQLDALRNELNALDEEANLQSFGFYKPRYAFAESSQYSAELDRIRDQQKVMLKNKMAATCRIEWTVNGSKVEGRKSTNQTLKLMLRAFNGESDAAIAKVKYNNVAVMEARILKAYEKINSMAEVQKCEIAKSYLDLKLKELYLAHEYQEKLQEEKEEQRRIREQMREEEIAQREIEKARIEAERDEERYRQALIKAREEVERAVGAKQEKLRVEIEELQRRLAEAQANKERAIARAQLTRSGHIYIISNIGSFGEHVYKIGMTRRLDPFERVRELSDASVPFQFDVHAVIYSEDAPNLENALHRAFHHRRVNRINERKEFFRAELEEIVTAVQQRHGQVEVTRVAEAVEYRKTQALIEEERNRAASVPTVNVLSQNTAPTQWSPSA
ncbi:MAG TPA: DUF4041 domain-containing protein [Thermoanaerobaculia bacterium]